MRNPETYVDIKDQVVQAYNRAMTAKAVYEEDGYDAATEYLVQFSMQDRASIAAMLASHARDPEDTLKRVQERVRATAH